VGHESTPSSESPTVASPPFDSGVGDPVTRTVFINPDRTVACRRPSGDHVWLECLLVRSNEIVRFDSDYGNVVVVPCGAPSKGANCRLVFGRITITHATSARKRVSREPVSSDSSR
jgi:hypothetical protein